MEDTKTQPDLKPRYRRVLVSGMFLTKIFTNGKLPLAVIANGVPPGSRFKYAIPDERYGVSIVIEHPGFGELDHGDEIPLIDSPQISVLTHREMVSQFRAYWSERVKEGKVSHITGMEDIMIQEFAKWLDQQVGS